MATNLKDRLTSTAFALRGYNLTNLGRTPELLEHAVYGPIMREHLEEAGTIASETVGERIDLVGRVLSRRESNLDTFIEDVSLIMAVELAQLRILREVFGIEWSDARLAFGYSLGEVAALVASGVYQLQHILPTPLELAKECVELGRNVTMGIVFSRGGELSFDRVNRLCLEINSEGQGVIAISSYLSPNTVLLLGQGTTIRRFKQRMHEELPKHVHLRTNKNRWPPLHTPLLWERSLPARAAYILHTIPGGFTAPKPPIVSLVTGKVSYNDWNSREILVRWIDHPQRLWDVVCEVLSAGVETIVHVGPEPNLVPATFKRLSDNVVAQMRGFTPAGFGMRAMTTLARRPWLSKILSTRTILLRAPFVQHVVLEDWLLEQPLP